MGYTFSESEYVCNVTIDGEHTWTVKMAYDGTMENKHFNGTSYFIVSSRNSDGNIEHVFQNAERKPMKTQTIRLVFNHINPIKLLLISCIQMIAPPRKYQFENLTKL